MEERRRNERHALSSTIIIKRLDGGGTDEEVTIDIVDVSKTGVGFTCNTPLTIGAVYESYLQIWTKETLHAFLEIVRIVKENGSFNYGAIFIGMPEMDMSRISVYETVSKMTE